MQKKLKRLLSIILTTTLILPISATTVSATEPTAQASTSDMDELDVLITANYFLNSSESEENFWPEDVTNYEIVPLYDLNENIVAYYISFSAERYAVINNNINNPTIIEYGEGDNHLIRNIIDSNTNPHIVYNNPFSVYELADIPNTFSGDGNEVTDIYGYYPDLDETNSELADLHAQQKASIQDLYSNEAVTYGDGDYGFVDWGSMPSGTYSSGNLPFAGTEWVITSDFDQFAKDHCGCTAVTNLAMYYKNRGYSKFNHATQLGIFIWAHQFVGNGPKMTIASDAKAFFKDIGYTLNYSSVSDMNGIKTATANGRPCGILLADGIVSWHWILSVGWRSYTNGGNYIRIMDGWNRHVNRFYKPYSGSLWVSATQYWM